MTTSTARPLAPASRPSPSLTIRRLRFAGEAGAGAKVRREFLQTRHVVAVEEAVEPANLSATQPWPEPTDCCVVVVVPRGAAADSLKDVEAWMAPPVDHPEAVPPVVVEWEGATIRWRPGRAVVQARPDRYEDALDAMTDFAFYEGELRALEAALEAHEAQAQADVAHAYRIRYRDRKHWKRFGELIEGFARMRLTYARLEPHLARGSRTLSPDARRVMARLLKSAVVAARLEALSNRLEALEDLYEGATDRVADFRWYRNGHLLEVGIILLLLVESVLMGSDIYMHYREHQQLTRLAEAAQEEATDESEEFRVIISKVADGKVTFVRAPLNPDVGATGTGEEQTYPLAADVKVYLGKIDKESKQVTAGDALPGGVKNEAFARVRDQGLRAVIVTDAENKKVAEIYVLLPGRKGQ